MRSGAIRSVPTLFQSLIDFAKRNPDRNTVWNYSDTVGIQNLLNRLKDGLKCVSKLLKLDDAFPQSLRVVEYFAVRNLTPRP